MDYDEFWSIVTGYRKSRIVHTAVIWKFFDYIGTGTTAEYIAKKANTDERATERILNALVGMEILRKSDGIYRHTELSRSQLVEQGDDNSLAGVRHALQSWENWGQLPDIVKTGELPDRKRVFDDPERYRTFILAMHQYQKHRAEQLVRQLPVKSGDTILDCGGGPGTYANTFQRLYPGADVTLFDLPDAIAIAKELNEGDLPIQYISGDFFEDDLGGPYDLVYLSNIIHSYSPDQNLDLLNRIYAAVKTGGRLVIRDRFLDDSETKPLGAVIFGIHMLVNNLQGGTYSVKELREWLQSVGFGKAEYQAIEGNGEIIIAEKLD